MREIENIKNNDQKLKKINKDKSNIKRDRYFWSSWFCIFIFSLTKMNKWLKKKKTKANNIGVQKKSHNKVRPN